MNNSDFIAMVLEALSIDVSACSDGDDHPALEEIWLHALEAEPADTSRASVLEAHIQECDSCRSLFDGAADELRTACGLAPIESSERKKLLRKTRERLRQWNRERRTGDKSRRPDENGAGNKAKPTVRG